MTVKVKRGPKTWKVLCSACEGDEVMWLMAQAFGGWVDCTNWETAMVMARWHQHLHDEQRCTTCCHEPPISKPEPVKDNLFKWEGRLYGVIGDEVCEMHPTRGAA